jgi:glyoxylase-like metal-dependent hydrolase (beta-lactamase superfamily II)
MRRDEVLSILAAHKHEFARFHVRSLALYGSVARHAARPNSDIDLLVEFEYSNYQNMNGVQVPTRIVQKQAGLATFAAEMKAATPNPANLTALLTPPPPPAGAPGGAAGGPPPAPAAAPVEKLGEGVFKIGGNYTSLAVDMGDHILVVESGQSDARGLAVMAAAKQAIPNKPIRFVVNSHPHFDHASGLAAAAAEGATILTHKNNEEAIEKLMSGSRTLTGDSLSKLPARRVNFFEAVGDNDVRKGNNGKVVELHRVPNEHSDGMLIVYLPAEKVVWSADVTAVNPNPGQLAVVRAVNETLTKLKVDYNSWIQAHPPNPDKPLTKADVVAAVGTK